MGSFKDYAGSFLDKKGRNYMSGGRYAYGKITKCVAARIYQHPTIQSTLVGTAMRGTDVMIVDGLNPGDYFCSVITSTGLRGYCMRVFLEVTSPQRKETEE